jgi:hypothetical protein
VATPSGSRAAAVLHVEIDGRVVLTRTYRPTGLRHDGPVVGYVEIPVAAGRRHVWAALATAGAPESDAHVLDRVIDVPAGRAPLLDYSVDAGWRP